MGKDARPEAADVVIAGGGLAGLSLALALKDGLGPDAAITVYDPGFGKPLTGDRRCSAIAAGARRLLTVLGVWDEVAEDERGLRVRGRIEPWSAVSRMAEALARAGALDGLSIGYRTARARRDGRLRVLSGVELWEVSLVTFPMLPGARFKIASGAAGGGSR